MSAADRLEDGFPHGTPAGFEQGCKGSACPEKLDGFLSCSESKTRYAGDWTYRRRVESGMSPADIRTAEALDASVAAVRAAQAPKVEPVEPKRQKRAEREKQLVRAAELRAENALAAAPDPVPLVKRAERVAVAPEVATQIGSLIPAELHGTTKGYSRGCRLKADCPGVESVGVSCTDAMSEYQRRWREGRGKQMPQARPERPVEAPQEPVEAVAEVPVPEVQIPLAGSLSFLTAAAVVRVTPMDDGGVEVTVRIGGAA